MALTSTPPPLLNLSSDSDDGDDANAPEILRCRTDLSDSIFRSYIEITGGSSPDLAKVESFLTSSRSGALSCLICLEKIRISDPTWNCFSGCFAVFHIVCIQNWARQASALAAARATVRLSPTLFPAAAAKAIEESVWNCPKCRVDYSKSLIPKSYFCFCGKLENPPCDPWILPHSCGEICGRPLRHNCGHHCLLLCHPGPCPSCPKLVKARCFCGEVEDVRRCGFKDFSCNGPCSMTLDCGVHRCSEACHGGPCPPCRAQSVYQCRCGKKNEERDCCDRDFRCDVPCERPLDCGKHVCEKGCHSGGECGECLYKGKRTCPCGKRMYEGMACDVVVPLCGATCDKMLSCGVHRCPERCHRGPCAETCRTVITKQCRCGSMKKGVPCHQVMACERKCQKLRDCGRHACKRRCCDGNCPPCSEVCDRKLRCRNHKCPSPCHRGPCAPCPIMVTIACSCGETRFEVPCGTEMEQKPPKCRKPCPIVPMCRHRPIIKPHRCHYGACPSCRVVCGEELFCGHTCKLRCHGPRPPPKPEFTLKPKKKKVNHQTECTPGTPCPPCAELDWRSCVGKHIGAERMMVCSNRSQFSCENLCGNLLQCGNHYCTKSCHALGESCEECHLACQKERECSHSCALPCHSGECPPCRVLVKRACYCGSMVHVFDCIYYSSLTQKEQMAARSCGGPCHRKLPNCTHLCPEKCHPGKCPSPEKCCKKVTVRCRCQTLKKEWICKDVQMFYQNAGSDTKDLPRSHFGHGLIPCNSDCKRKEKVSEANLEHNLEKKELDPDTNKYVGKRRRRRDRLQTKEPSRLQKMMASMKRPLLFAFLVVFLLAAAYDICLVLLWLSDRMNKKDIEWKRGHSEF